jgi:hypothetical protein
VDPIVSRSLKVLTGMGAPPRLVRHGELVAEAAIDLVDELEDLGVPVDREWVLSAAVLHDAGKVAPPEELRAPGSSHEPRGEERLLAAGVAPHVARCCRSHASWSGPDLALEELLVALADKLWKGSRVDDLELRVIDRVAIARAQSRWDVFERLDARFEAIARRGPARLDRQ